ncbi:hypothetical protein EW093_16660 [Thiospirochaeta perfilievii]|uniref:Uncharacterized protein n=1 Tax=Thiospirochaeta perfilievii TaxID=252967 RepID=A0A5C1QGQ0_9SPIO|nr:hypothetical protein [Thiospirochaeta perfilievii]QEN06250.1 hypothetical protein EW093_16660 [Thiospirochaeta perfilievii]
MILYWIKVIVYEIISKINKLFIKTKKHDFQVNLVHDSYHKINDRKWIYYRKLIKKYPEMIWTKKYIKANKTIAIKGILALHARDEFNLKTLWTYDATINDLFYFLSLNVPIISEIMLSSKSPHCITVKKYHKSTNRIWFSDTLGNYNSNYYFRYYKSFINLNKFIEINTGNPVFVSISLPVNHPNYSLVRNRIFKYKFYEI